MRAAVLRERQLVVDTVPDPEPRAGEVLVRTLACGICGSDLHMLEHADALVAAARESGVPFGLDPARDVVLGHEFCAEVLALGPDTTAAVRPGDRVVAMPMLFRGSGIVPIGFSNEVPGGYGERMVLSAALALPVPDGLSTEQAALTEPMAVGLHAVAKGAVQAHDTAIVVGCGPVGLAVIAALALRGIAPIVAADYSPLRRELAARMGAQVVVDPATGAVIDAWREAAAPRSCVLFECVGVPGMLAEAIRIAPPGTRIVVAGACMEEDRLRPIVAVNKELSLHFVLGYTPEEFAAALASLADGRIDATPLVTDRVGLGGVAGAFRALARPETHAKILVEPWRS